MTNKNAGWALGLGALGMMLGLMASDIHDLANWNAVWEPSFVASMFAHMSVVIMAFLGGKLIPTEPQDQRKEDK
jgi:hypothetical protein